MLGRERAITRWDPPRASWYIASRAGDYGGGGLDDCGHPGSRFALGRVPGARRSCGRVIARAAPTRSATSTTGSPARPHQRHVTATAHDAARSSLQRPMFVPSAVARADDARRRSVAATCCSCSLGAGGRHALRSRCSPVRRRSSCCNLLADAALAGVRVPADPVSSSSAQDQRSKVRFLGSAYRSPAPYLDGP